MSTDPNTPAPYADPYAPAPAAPYADPNYFTPATSTAVTVSVPNPYADPLPFGMVRLPDGSIVTTAAQLPRKNVAAFFWLTFFLGGFGAGRFYMKHIGWGLAYLFTLGFLGIGALIDLFRAWDVTRNENEKRGYGRVTK